MYTFTYLAVLTQFNDVKFFFISPFLLLINYLAIQFIHASAILLKMMPGILTCMSLNAYKTFFFVENISKSEHARSWSVTCSTLVRCLSFLKYFYQYRFSSPVCNACNSTFSAKIVTVPFKIFKYSVVSIPIDFNLLYSVSKVSNLSFLYLLFEYHCEVFRSFLLFFLNFPTDLFSVVTWRSAICVQSIRILLIVGTSKIFSNIDLILLY